MKRLEPFWYEISPYIYGVTGTVAIFKLDGGAKFFGIILIASAATIIGMRKSYREIEYRNKRSWHGIRR